jgi:hypothetical protein
MVRQTLIILLVLAVAMCAPAGAPANQRLAGAGFRSLAPSGWGVKKGHAGGWRHVQVTSPTGADGDLGDTARITISWIPAVALRRRIKRPVPHDPVTLVRTLLTLPRGAGSVATTTAPTATTLAGWPGGVTIVSYLYEDAFQLQQTTIALVRHRRVYELKLRTDSDVTAVGTAALNTIRDSWRWH